MNMNPTKLYHYCSLKTLFSILDSQTLWFSDLTKSNDPYECELLYKELIRYLNEKKKDFFEGSLSFLRKQVEENTHVYGICFTEEANQLVHWSTYAKDNGVCITFDYDYLSKLFDSLNILDSNDLKNFDKMNYGINSEKANKLFNEEISNVTDNLQCIRSVIKNESLFKTDFWASEKEYRMCFRMFSNEVDVKLVKKGSKSCKKDSIERNGEYIFHYEIPISIKQIKEITIGPNSTVNATMLKEYLLNRYGNKLNANLIVNDCFEDYKQQILKEDD